MLVLLEKKKNPPVVTCKIISPQVLNTLSDYQIVDCSESNTTIAKIRFITRYQKVGLTNCDLSLVRDLLKPEVQETLDHEVLILVDPAASGLVRTLFPNLRNKKKQDPKPTLRLSCVNLRTWYYNHLKKGLVHDKHPSIYNNLIYNDDIYKKYYL